MFTKEMQKALEEDAKKLSDLTGEEHEVSFLEDCAVCDGHGFYDDPRVPCDFCNGTGLQRY